MGLQAYIEERKKDKDLLVMAHVVCGYPSFSDNMKELEIMSATGVDIVELQFPFSEPSADGPLFVKANEESLKSGTTVDQCFDFMKQVSERFSFKVLMMGYYNTAFRMGEELFVRRIKDAGGSGYILPDLPIEESSNLHAISEREGIEPIILMTPTSSKRCRQHTTVPIGVGFGISSKADMDFLRGSADLAIVGTAALKVWEESREDGLTKFFKELMA